MRSHSEGHLVSRIGWLRAAVLGANDGIVSTASLIMGVAAADPSRATILLTGLAGLVAGAMSMAAGEYVSVRSQADTEAADREKEVAELAAAPEAELIDLASIYRERGVDPATARAVAEQLMAHDAIGAHMRDELGLHEALAARPVQAAAASAASFAAGAIVPLLTAILTPHAMLVWVLPTVTVALLAALGGLGARAGGAPVAAAMVRVAFWGAAAMAVTAAIGRVAGANL
ncbi:VIT1/CCC1 transporter family protein [Sphingomonas donggukensis]|uniref:VIT1/CCC1 transporter family protein n=1 Tax=Sphingomonas donggukensis TaxID=2949093 RepID=A0ABY4TRG0_9SPHN|nr:VIT1/CCC1 transporter family protein [Sphingomonas donggukensis]URW74410.1 VIT1/CCC1 transporter family protein [Sphingomonas donggukensis]